MAVTKFGEEVRLARRSTNDTLLTMSEALGKSVAFISAIETGRSKIPLDFVEKIEKFFAEKEYFFEVDLKVLANVENKNVPLDGLTVQHQMMIAGFANSQLSNEQIQRLSKLFEEIKVTSKCNSIED